MNSDLSNLDLSGLLERLVPVPEPAVISLWPQTQAWVWLGFVIVAVLVWLIHRWSARWRGNAYRRAALREIAVVGNSPAAIAAILRRTALVAYPRREVAGLYGNDWLAFLDRTSRGNHFSGGLGDAFLRAAYSPETDGTTQYAALVIRWVRQHRREIQGRR